jgi:protein gp37
MAKRLRGRFGYPADEPFRVTFHPERLDAPRKWIHERVFVNSMGDLFAAPPKWIDAVFSTMYRDRHENSFIILTKLPALAALYVDRMWDRDDAPMPRGDYRRIIIGTSVSDQPTADMFIPEILKIRRFTLAVSVEPMLGPVDLTRVGGVEDGIGWRASCDALAGGLWEARARAERYTRVRENPPALDWVICGGETGPGARPMHPDWTRSLRDQCQATGVPFFFKQWGEWVSVSEVEGPGVHRHFLDGATVRRTGKKLAGCLLDGREWKEFPEVKGQWVKE